MDVFAFNHKPSIYLHYLKGINVHSTNDISNNELTDTAKAFM